MTSWGYLILIVALLGLAGVMLYARFASRSREKSLHHAPVDWVFTDEVISSATVSGESSQVGGDVSREPIADTATEEASPMEEELLPVPRIHVGPVGAEASVENRRERDYIDELQEAAAGLAMLMRSSPVSRPEPVVFAPEEPSLSPAVVAELSEAPAVEETVEEALQEEVSPETPSEVVEFVVEEAAVLSVAEEGVESVEEIVQVAEEAAEVTVEVEETATVVDEPVIAEAEGEPFESLASRAASEPRTFGEILGEAVMEQLGRIDDGLDALESLVIGIESSLRALGDLDRSDSGLPLISEAGEAAAA